MGLGKQPRRERQQCHRERDRESTHKHGGGKRKTV